jgi:hypothetical protein
MPVLFCSYLLARLVIRDFITVGALSMRCHNLVCDMKPTIRRPTHYRMCRFSSFDKSLLSTGNHTSGKEMCLVDESLGARPMYESKSGLLPSCQTCDKRLYHCRSLEYASICQCYFVCFAFWASYYWIEVSNGSSWAGWARMKENRPSFLDSILRSLAPNLSLATRNQSIKAWVCLAHIVRR